MDKIQKYIINYIMNNLKFEIITNYIKNVEIIKL